MNLHHYYDRLSKTVTDYSKMSASEQDNLRNFLDMRERQDQAAAKSAAEWEKRKAENAKFFAERGASK